jgi:VanZ family protein
MFGSGNASGSAIRRWLPPVLWASLILSVSLLPDSFFYFGVPRTREARRVHYYFEAAVHIFQFCVFFMLVNRPLRSAHRSRAGALVGALAAVLLLSLTNESVQALTPTRMFDLGDMAMDALGGLVGLGLAMVRDAS